MQIDPEDPRLMEWERHVLRGIAARLADQAAVSAPPPKASKPAVRRVRHSGYMMDSRRWIDRC